MKQEPIYNFIVAYNNGYVMRQTRISGDYLTQVEIGVIRHIIDLEQNKIWTRSEDGTCKETTLHNFHNP